MAEAFAATAADRPDAPALDIDGEAATHGELDARAARIGGFLRARGVGPRGRLLLCGAPAMALVAADLAIVGAGAAAMPGGAAPPAAPPRRPPAGWGPRAAVV